MDQPAFLDSLTKALITFPYVGAQGILIPCGHVITAAHCIVSEMDYKPYPHNRAFTGFSLPLTAKNAGGKVFPLIPLFIDVVSDVAILCPSDKPEHYGHEKFDPGRFYRFARRLKKAVPRFAINLNPSLDIRRMKAWVHQQNHGWLPIHVCKGLDYPNQLIFKSDVAIGPAISGSPIVTNKGKLLGVVSNTIHLKSSGNCTGSFAHAAAILPRWYLWEVKEQEMEEELE